jgi:hypothetical protein
VKLPTNLARLFAAVSIALFITEVVPLGWQCHRCGHRFVALGDVSRADSNANGKT